MNKYIEKAAKIKERSPGVRYEPGTRDYFVDRSFAEELQKPYDSEHRANGRNIIGALGAISGALPAAMEGSWKGSLAGAAIGGLVGVGLGHVLANAGTKQDREHFLRERARNHIGKSHGVWNAKVTLEN